MHYFVSILVLQSNRRLVALLLLSYRCFTTINVMWVFLMLPWVCLLCVIVVFPYHTLLLCPVLLKGLILIEFSLLLWALPVSNKMTEL